mgnify:CR=1 FL=1
MVSDDGTKQVQGQVICRVDETNHTSGVANDPRYTTYVIQVQTKKYGLKRRSFRKFRFS